MTVRLIIFICTIPLFTSAQAVDIYKWVDEKGQTHFSDSPPEKYKTTAKKSDSRQYELFEAQKNEVAKRKQIASATTVTQKKEVTNPTSSSTPLNPAPSEDISSDCAALFKAYYDSQICFAPYKNRNGSMKPGAHENCKQVEDPTPKCGPVKTSPQLPY